MIIMTLMFCVTLIIPFFMIILNYLLSKKLIKSMEKATSFECGFDPLAPNRQPFNIQFFLISMIFLIFDIEIVLLIPLIQMMHKLSVHNIMIFIIFLLILLLGLYFEYMEKSLNWNM